MGLKSITRNVKLKVAEKVTENLAEKAEAGAMGPTVQKAYVKTKAYGAGICGIILVFTMAVDFYLPPWAEQYAHATGFLFMGLTWLGIVDAAKRNEPFFEPWLLEAFRQAAAAFAGAAAVMLAIAQSGLVQTFLPDQPCAPDYLTFGATAAGSLAMFFNRVLAAAVAPATPTPTLNQGNKP